MLKTKRLPLWMSVAAILALGVLLSSCYQPGTTQTTPSSQYNEPAPGQGVNDAVPLTPIEELGITGVAPDVDMEQYRLTVDGLVNTPLTFTYESLMQYPAVTEVVLLICPDTFINNAEWTGVPVTTLLAEAGIKPEASEVTFYALDGYEVTLSLKTVQQEGVFLAYKVNGQILPKEHGYPLRLVAKGELGFNWVKWVERVEVT